MSAPTFTSTLTAFLSIVGAGPPARNSQDVPIAAWQNTTSPAQVQNVTWNAGNNYVVPPQSPQNAAQVAIIVFQTLPGTVTLKGVNADTGYQIGAAGFAVVPIGTVAGGDGNLGSFVINVSVQTTATIYFI